VERIRAKVTEIVTDLPLCDAGRRCAAGHRRHPFHDGAACPSGRTAAAVFDLRCLVRERLIAFLQAEHLQALPRRRAALDMKEAVAAIDGGRGAPGTDERSEHPRAVSPRLNDTGLPSLRHHVR
jgi:hypothetical protein